MDLETPFWQVTCTSLVRDGITALLRCGWEPFSVAASSGAPNRGDYQPGQIWMRRPALSAALAGFVKYEDAVKE